MIIVRCNKCGELIHKADRCFVCGSTIGFTEVNSSLMVHENIKNEYESLDYLVKNGKYDEALELSELILEWMPFCSDVFWLRLLAKNHCDTDEALIRKGVSCEDSADYYNAVLFANEVQKKVYTGIKAKMATIKKILIQYITEHEYFEKGNTAILKIQMDFPAKIEAYRKKLFQLWEELRQFESQMIVLEKDCLLLVNEHMEALKKDSSEADSIKARVYKMEQCSAEDFHNYQTRFDNLLYQSEEEKTYISTMNRKSSLMESYNALVKKRDGIVTQINNEINLLKDYESSVQSTISEIEKIETLHTAALVEAAKYDFSKIRSLLGENRFMAAFVEAGIRLQEV